MSKLVVVGLDGATWRALEPMIEEGKLETLASIRDEATWGTLESIRPPISCPAWFCYSTGKNPGKLGIFGWRNFDPATRTDRFNDYKQLTDPEIWDYVGQAGYKSAVINIPTMFPPKAIEGYMVCGMQAAEHQDYTHPPELKRRLKDELGYRVSPKHKLMWDYEEAYRETLELFPKRFQAALELIDEVDLLHVTIFHIDEVQHNDWLGEDMAHAWEVIDGHLGDFLEALPEDTDVLFMSDHGFTERSTKLHINTWLEENGYLTRTANPVGDVLRTVGITRERMQRVLMRFNAIDLAKALVPARLQQLVQEEDGATTNQRRLPEIDWEKTVAFASTNFTLHVLDDARRDELIEELEALESPSGEPFFEEVLAAEDVLHGDKMAQAPDILLLPADGMGVGDGLGKPLWEQHHSSAGGHAMDGIVMATGPSFTRGEITGARLVDLAPTILHAMGLPVPADMDGQVLDIFADDRQVRTTDELADTGTFSEDELEQVEERLRGLGYLE